MTELGFLTLRRLVVLVGLGTMVVACKGGDESSPATTVAANASDTAVHPSTFRVTAAQRARLQVITVDETSFTPMVEATGTVAFNGDRSTQVISPISGPVVRLVAQLGTRVGAGQVLATVSSPDFATAVADYRKAEAMLRNATRILDRNEQLFANDALARGELDQSRTDAAAANADRDAAAQQLRSLGIEQSTITAIHEGKIVPLIEGSIRAPISGQVVEKLITPGQLLQAGTTPAFTIADLSSMWVLANVYGDDIGAVRNGVAVDVLTDVSPTAVTGHVDFVAPIVDPGTRATTVRILAANPGQLLKRDMFVRVRLHGSRARTGLVLPASAILRDDDNLPFVFIANRDSSFSRRRITIGASVDGGVEVASGVKAGERVLADGALFVQFAEHQ